jgi:opacity protein-like surface antigen
VRPDDQRTALSLLLFLLLLVVAVAIIPMFGAGCAHRPAAMRRSAELVESIVNASLASEPYAVAEAWRAAGGAGPASAVAGQDTGLLSLQSGPLVADKALAEDPGYPGRWFIGARAGVNAGDGEPANDIPTYGLLGRYRVRGPWLVGLALDWANFDFEQPGNLINVDPVGVVDATIDSTSVTAWGEYEFRLKGDGLIRRLRPFVGAGVGVAFLSDDDNLSGATETGGTYDFDISGGTEIVPGALAGVRIDVTRNVVFEVGGRYDFHVTELQIRDNVSGNSADVDDYSTFGGYVALLFRF